ncbi:HD domain-containing phosphohydrolase [Polynucleobacter arcticus]
MAALVNASEDGIIGEDVHGVITSWNQSAEKIFGYTAQESIGKSTTFLLPSNRLTEESAILNRILKGESVGRLETERVCKGGHHITVSLITSPIYDLNSNLIGVLRIVRDITLQKNEAQALLDVNKELAFQNTEKARRAAELVIANEELAYQNEEKEKRVKELVFQNEEKAKRAAELVIANDEKAKRLHELVVANDELLYQNEEKAKRAAELVVANEELVHQNEQKAKRAAELVIAADEKAKRVHQLVVANDELLYQGEEKAKRAAELAVANEEKTKRVDELVIANLEKDKRAAELNASIKETHQTVHQMLSSLNALALARDNETGNHVIRTQHYVRAIATRLLEMGHYLDQINGQTIELMFNAAPLHDIGKVGIPDAILQKPGKLTDDEWTIMKTHTTIGENILSAAHLQSDKANPIINMAHKIAGSHHERWDGTGYPRGLKGEDIPLAGRIMAIADVYDALVSKRVYKPKWTYEEGISEILSLRALQFDPLIVDAFVLEESHFNEIAQLHHDA